MKFPNTRFTFYAWDDGWEAQFHFYASGVLRTVSLSRNKFPFKADVTFKVEKNSRARANLLLSAIYNSALCSPNYYQELARKISGLADDLNFGIHDGSFVILSKSTFAEGLRPLFQVNPEDRIHGTLVFPTKEEHELFVAMGLPSPFLWPNEEAGAFIQAALNEGRIRNDLGEPE